MRTLVVHVCCTRSTTAGAMHSFLWKSKDDYSQFNDSLPRHFCKKNYFIDLPEIPRFELSRFKSAIRFFARSLLMLNSRRLLVQKITHGDADEWKYFKCRYCRFLKAVLSLNRRILYILFLALLYISTVCFELTKHDDIWGVILEVHTSYRIYKTIVIYSQIAIWVFIAWLFKWFMIWLNMAAQGLVN